MTDLTRGAGAVGGCPATCPGAGHLSTEQPVHFFAEPATGPARTTNRARGISRTGVRSAACRTLPPVVLSVQLRNSMTIRWLRMVLNRLP
jgi:hypothetical protein